MSAKKYYIRMLEYVKPYKSRAIFAILLTIPVGSMDAVIAWSIKPYMDTVMLETGKEPSLFLPLVIVAFSIAQSIFSYLAAYFNGWVGCRVTMDLKKELFDKMIGKESDFFDKKTSGDVLFRFNADAENACNGLLDSSKLFFTKFFTAISLIVVLIYNSFKLAFVAVSILTVALYPVAIIRKKIKEIQSLTVKSGAAVMTHYNEAFIGNRVITSYNLQNDKNSRFSDTLNSVFKLSMKTVQKTGLLTPMMHFIISIGIASVIYLGHYLIASGQLTPGGFVSFLAALLMLYSPMKNIGSG